MNFRTVFIFSLLLYNFSLFSQKDLSPINIQRLAHLCKQWGAHKYFDNRISRYNIDLDEVLLAKIDQLTSDTVSNDYDVNLEKEVLEIIQKRNGSAVTGTGNYFLSDKSYLTRLNDSSRYIKLNKGFSAELSSDNKYSNVDMPPANYRLLSLFRLYNAIEYFGPFRDSSMIPFDSLLYRYIEKFWLAKTKASYYLTLMEYMSCLRDGHAIPFSSQREIFFGRYALPFKIESIDNKAIITALINRRKCKKYSFKVGQEIVSLNEQPIRDRISQYDKYISVTQPKYKRDISLSVGFNHKRCVAVLKAGDTTENKKVALDRRIVNVVKTVRQHSKLPKFKLYKNDIVYCNLTTTNKGDFSEITKAHLKNSKALIVDLRGYPRTGNIEIITDLLFDQAAPVAKLFTPSNTSPRNFVSTIDSIVPAKDGFQYDGQIVVLVNETTISQGEYCCMILQAISKNTIVVGSATAGCDGNVCMITLPGQISAMFTGMRVTYPDETETQNRGVKINYVVEQTREDYIKGNDAQLTFALNFLQGKK